MGEVLDFRTGRRMPVGRPGDGRSGDVRSGDERPGDARSGDGRTVRERVERMPRAGEASEPPPLWREVVGAFLRGERLAQERILTEVARRAGVSPQYLSEVERGLKEPSSEVLEAVAGALGHELGDVLRGVGERLTRVRRVSDLGRSTDASSRPGSPPASAPMPPELRAA